MSGIFLAAIMLVSGCSKNNVTGTNTPKVPDTWYGHHIQVIFNQSCGSPYGNCHISGSMYNINLSSYKNVINDYSSEYGKKMVIPGNASGSPLMNKISSHPTYGYRMPYGRAPLSTAQIDTIKTWINKGATNK
ncbi:MAG TPA: hypothetical protein VKA34_10880 [Balneolales bacterium]|nr:hypothetical protein [Balneolales bacterium]